MQVKGTQAISVSCHVFRLTNPPTIDYLQALVDENKVRCEKIGSGNWYWSFPSADMISKQKLLKDAQSGYDKANALVQDLRNKIAEKAAQLEEEEDILDNPGESREEVMTVKLEVEKELKDLMKELATYSENDPTELENKKKQVNVWYEEANECSEDIQSMEGWLKDLTAGEGLEQLKKDLYGKEYDEEEGGLRDLVLSI